MDTKAYSPAEIAEIWAKNGVNKASLSVTKMIFLSIFAGMFIGFGAIGFLTMTANMTGELAGLGKLLGASLFPVGLIMVALCGAELFTGNNLMTVALLDKRITLGQMLRNWVIVYLGNIVGSYLLAFLVYHTGLFGGAMGENIAKIATTKVSLTFMQALLRGVLCNILVVLSLWLQAGSKDLIGKIVGIFFPIMLFVFCGFEHSVANMFYLPLGQLCGASVTTAQVWLNNILPVTLGNIIGGAVFVSSIYYFVYVRKAKEAAKQ